jgi:hypothetical protein
VTVSVAVFFTLPTDAVIVADVVAVTGAVVMANEVELAPAGIVTLAGTVAAAVRLLASVTTRPPAGAIPVSVTVPVDGVPPWTDVGFSVSVLGAAGLTVSVAFFDADPYVAVIAGFAAAVTAVVETVNGADV